jgi:Fic family protein
VRAEVDELRQAASSTIHDKTPTPESKVASQNWQRADQKVKAWAASKEPLSLARIQEINGTLQDGIGKPGTPGQLRNQPASAGGLFHKMYIDPAQLDGRMAAFLEWYHANQSTMPPIELAAGAYQRLVSIHPFADANGRTCRLVMDWILENHGLPPATFGDNEHNIAVYWSDAYNNNGVTTEQAVAAVTKGIERTIQIMGRAGQ